MTQPSIETYFDLLAPEYDVRARDIIGNQNNTVFGAMLGRLVLEQGYASRSSLIDLGVGTGNTVLEASKHIDLDHVIGIDASQAMLNEAERKLRSAGIIFEAIQGSIIDRLAVLTGQFDMVSGVSVVEYINEHDYDELFFHIGERLRPGGALIFNHLPLVPGHPEWGESGLSFRHPTTGMEAAIYRSHRHDIVERLGRCGLTVIMEQYYSPQSSNPDKQAIMLAAVRGG